MTSPVIIGAARTAIGTSGGMFRDVEVVELLAPVLRNLADAHDVPINEVVAGNVRGPGGNVARVAALAAGLDVAIPAVTVDRQCGSGMAAVEYATLIARSGRRGMVLAGGTQSASTQPLTFWQGVDGADPIEYDRAPFAPACIGDPEMGAANDLMAQRLGITRERQDAYASRSHARAVQALADGSYASELVAVNGLTRDERPRDRFTTERLARFRPIFLPDGTVTAANSCGVNDGAAAVAMVDEQTWRELGVPGLRVLSVVSVGCDPNEPGWGIVPAVQAALAEARLGIDAIDVIEFNEAFAGQMCACADALGIDEQLICPQGGALALGHPWAASGAVLVTRLFTQLVTQQAGRFGVAAIGIGGGQGSAMVVEAC